MKTLDEDNQEKLDFLKEAKKKEHLSSVLCPKCKKAEMIFPRPYELLASNPPQKIIECPNCGHHGYKLCKR